MAYGCFVFDLSCSFLAFTLFSPVKSIFLLVTIHMSHSISRVPRILPPTNPDSLAPCLTLVFPFCLPLVRSWPTAENCIVVALAPALVTARRVVGTGLNQCRKWSSIVCFGEGYPPGRMRTLHAICMQVYRGCLKWFHEVLRSKKKTHHDAAQQGSNIFIANYRPSSPVYPK